MMNGQGEDYGTTGGKPGRTIPPRSSLLFVRIITHYLVHWNVIAHDKLARARLPPEFVRDFRGLNEVQ